MKSSSQPNADPQHERNPTNVLEQLCNVCPCLLELLTSASPVLDIDSLFEPTAAYPDPVQTLLAEVQEFGKLFQNKHLLDVFFIQRYVDITESEVDDRGVDGMDLATNELHREWDIEPSVAFLALRNVYAVLCLLGRLDCTGPELTRAVNALVSLSKDSIALQFPTLNATMTFDHRVFNKVQDATTEQLTCMQRAVGLLDDLFRHYYTLCLAPECAPITSLLSSMLDVPKVFHLAAVTSNICDYSVIFLPNKFPSIPLPSPSTLTHIKSLYIGTLDRGPDAYSPFIAFAFTSLRSIFIHHPFPLSPDRIVDSFDMNAPSSSLDLQHLQRCLNHSLLLLRSVDTLSDLQLSIPLSSSLYPLVSETLKISWSQVYYACIILASLPCMDRLPSVPDLIPYISMISRQYLRMIEAHSSNTLNSFTTFYASCDSYGIFARALYDLCAFAQMTILTRSDTDIGSLLDAPYFIECLIDIFMYRPELSRLNASEANKDRKALYCSFTLSSCLLVYFLTSLPLRRVQARLIQAQRLVPLLRFCREGPSPGRLNMSPIANRERATRFMVLHALSGPGSSQDRNAIFSLEPGLDTRLFAAGSRKPTPTDFDPQGFLLRRELAMYMRLSLNAVPFLYGMRHYVVDPPHGLGDVIRLYIGAGPHKNMIVADMSNTLQGDLNVWMHVIKTLRRRDYATDPNGRVASLMIDYCLLIKRLCRSYTLGQRITGKLKGKRTEAFVSGRLGGVAVDLRWRELPSSARDELRKLDGLADEVLGLLREGRGRIVQLEEA